VKRAEACDRTGSVQERQVKGKGGNKGYRWQLEKRRGTRMSSYLARAGLTNATSSDAIPHAAGSEGGYRGR
jgi:hypothetical protein